MQKPMRTIWHSLLWKEWHEHKWKLLGLILMVLIFFAMFGRGRLPMLPVGVSTALFCYSILAGLFVGMSTAAGENGRGTMPFLQTLPVAMNKPAKAKLLMSWFSVVIPVFVLIGLVYAFLKMQGIDDAELAEGVEWSRSIGIFRSFGFQNWLLGLGLSSILFVTSFLFWMSATGVDRSDEIRAGAIGFLTMALLWFCLAMLANRADKSNMLLLEQGIGIVMTGAPGGPGFIGTFQDLIGSSLPLFIFAALAHGCVVARYLHRFGQKSVRPARTLGGNITATSTDWLAPPRRSQLTAIIWKQICETGPLALMAAAAVVVMAGLAYWANSESKFRSSFGEMLGGITLGVGYLVTVVAGMGVFLEDVKPRVSIFWRSRPVNTTLWFFVKFFTGLAVLIVTFGSLLLLANYFQGAHPLLDPKHAGLQVAFFGMIFLLLYTLSMASYCLGRQPVIAAVAAISVFLLGAYAFDYLLSKSLPMDSRPPVAFFLMILAQMAATTLAYLTMRNNWGWHK